jgi:hypothetical protein
MAEDVDQTREMESKKNETGTHTNLDGDKSEHDPCFIRVKRYRRFLYIDQGNRAAARDLRLPKSVARRSG